MPIYIYVCSTHSPGTTLHFHPLDWFSTPLDEKAKARTSISSLSFSPSRNIFIGFERYFVVSLVTISQGINRGGNCFLDERNSSLNRILVREFLSPRTPFNPKNLNHHLPSEKSPPSCIFVKLYSRGDIWGLKIWKFFIYVVVIINYIQELLIDCKSVRIRCQKCKIMVLSERIFTFSRSIKSKNVRHDIQNEFEKARTRNYSCIRIRNCITR